MMKTCRTRWLGNALLALSLVNGGWLAAGEAVVPTNAPSVRIGVYDSRAVAYAWFWSKEHQTDLERQRQAIKAAHDAKDTSLARKLDKALVEQQQSIHQQVFSGAPPTEALAVIQIRLPELLRQAGVSVLVSQWDAPALGAYKSAVQVDVTELLTREFNPDEKRLEVIRQIRSKPLVAVDRID
jgi:hypothetical protein